MKPKTKFKWYYCVVLGLANIIDGLTMTLTLGYFTTNLSLKYALWGASRKIYRMSNEAINGNFAKPMLAVVLIFGRYLMVSHTNHFLNL